MNIKTKAVQAISNQLQLPLFNQFTYVEEPILFFGYKKNQIGQISEPKLVYMDEDCIKWIVTNKDVNDVNSIVINQVKTAEAAPTLKEEKKGRRKSG